MTDVIHKEAMPYSIIEKPVGDVNVSIFLVRRGLQKPRGIYYFGLGASDKSFPDPYLTIEAINEVINKQPASPCLFGVYNTDASFSAHDANMETGDFLDTELAKSYAGSLENAGQILNGEKVISTYESYSGGLLLAMLTAALKNPDHPTSQKFLTNLRNTSDRVAVLAPAIAVSKYNNIRLGLLRLYAMQKKPNALELSLIEKAGLKNEILNMMSGGFLERDYQKMLAQYIARTRHLVLFERVFNDNIQGLSVPENISLPKIIVIHHKKDNYVNYKKTCKALQPLDGLGIIELRQAGLDFTGKDKHNLYANEENRKPLRDLITA